MSRLDRWMEDSARRLARVQGRRSFLARAGRVLIGATGVALVPVLPVVAEALGEYIDACPHDLPGDGPLFVGKRGKRLSARMIQRQMPDRQQAFFSELPLLFVGTADASGRPWASVLVGQPGFLQPVDASVLRVEARPIYGDPLEGVLIEDAHIGTLGMDFETRNRARMNGTIANVNAAGFEIRVAQSFGNCDWYIQSRELAFNTHLSAIGEKRVVRRDKTLDQREAALVARADAFFVPPEIL